MGGFFGITSKKNCIDDLFFCTDYHFHLGTKFGGLAIKTKKGFKKPIIHNISNSQFRSEFEDDIKNLHANQGIGIISDCEPQPLLIGSHLGTFAITTIGKIHNIDEVVTEAYKNRISFSERSEGINPTELVSKLISQETTFEDGIQHAQETIKGSCSMLLSTEKGIYAARDKLGRTPIVLGKKNGAYAATSETCAFPTRDFEIEKYLGPGEIILLTQDGYEEKKSPENKMQICSFLWVYYGFPASDYEGINVEIVRNRCGAILAKRDVKSGIKIDSAADIPDSGTPHLIGYINEAKISHKRVLVKYTQTYGRSFMPPNQKTRNLVAKMKLIPIRENIEGQRILLCEDSIVRGTQLRNTIQILYDYGASEVHMRPSCPPLIYPCDFLNFSRSRSPSVLAGRRAIKELEERSNRNLKEYSRYGSEKYCSMVELIRQHLKLTSLEYQKLNDLVEAIGLPKEKLCTHCWDGTSYF